jgi:hypothetical protein
METNNNAFSDVQNNLNKFGEQTFFEDDFSQKLQNQKGIENLFLRFHINVDQTAESYDMSGIELKFKDFKIVEDSGESYLIGCQILKDEAQVLSEKDSKYVPFHRDRRFYSVTKNPIHKPEDNDDLDFFMLEPDFKPSSEYNYRVVFENGSSGKTNSELKYVYYFLKNRHSIVFIPDPKNVFISEPKKIKETEKKGQLSIEVVIDVNNLQVEINPMGLPNDQQKKFVENLQTRMIEIVNDEKKYPKIFHQYVNTKYPNKLNQNKKELINVINDEKNFLVKYTRIDFVLDVLKEEYSLKDNAEVLNLIYQATPEKEKELKAILIKHINNLTTLEEVRKVRDKFENVKLRGG